MNLKNKKKLVGKTMSVGIDRVIINRPEEIKEAITRQDMRDLIQAGAVSIKEVKGRRKVEKRKRRRGKGNLRKTVNKRKENYMIMTRKLRKYVRILKKQGKITNEKYHEIRKKIRGKEFRSLAYMQEHLQGKGKIRKKK